MRPVKVKTELNVKSSHTLSENVFLHDKNGAILDENSREKVELNEYTSRVEEDWLPVGGDELPLPGSSNGGAELAASNSYADLPAGSDEAGKSLRDRLKSTDSELVNERLESLCMNNRQLAAEKVNNSQESLDISIRVTLRVLRGQLQDGAK